MIDLEWILDETGRWQILPSGYLMFGKPRGSVVPADPDDMRGPWPLGAATSVSGS